MDYKKYIIIFSCIFLSLTLYSQRFAKGYVIDPELNEFVEGAQVNVKGTNIIVLTDDNGSFRIEVPKKMHHLVINREGYKDVTIRLTPGFQHKNIRVQLRSLVPANSPAAGIRSTSDSIYGTYRNALTYSPLELITGAVAFRYERFIVQKHSIGLHNSIYLFGRNPIVLGSEYEYDMHYHGYKGTLFYRYYPKRKDAGGFFLEGKLPAGYFHFDKVDYRISSGDPRKYYKETYFWSVGFGISAGVMVRLGSSQHGVMNISIGYQYFPCKIAESADYYINDETTITVDTDNNWWYWGGPGSYIDLKFTIGGIF